ncbi:unnamed protein product [Dibothriocephalus latus]|uniref:Uncharacterized protein n=1 Tax=Dibothriocephalus latus TaxID=60516 RepID=A0A3P6QVH3_DIBLA|nr:unnamed protein product [Dibothriocephalus latus]
MLSVNFVFVKLVFLTEKQLDINMETQHFRLETERLRAENKSLLNKLDDTRKALKKQDDLIAANQVLHKQMELHAGRLAEAHSQGKYQHSSLLKSVNFSISGSAL